MGARMDVLCIVYCIERLVIVVTVRSQKAKYRGGPSWGSGLRPFVRWGVSSGLCVVA